MTRSSSKSTTPRSVRCAALVLLALALAPGSPPASGVPGDGPNAEALTNEDIVRMVSEHRTVREILDAIHAAALVDFDLDPDVVVELRRAHVPEPVIAAMKERVARQPVGETSPPPAVASPTGVLELIFEKIDSGAPAKSTAVALAKDWNDRAVSLAFFVYCFDPLHVPDLWDQKTPLIKGFPRHHLIWFHEATLPWRENRRGGMVYLDLPGKNSVEVPAGTHPLELGVVSHAQGEPWTLVARTEATLEIKEGMTTRLILKVTSRRADRLDIALGGAPTVTCEVVKKEGPDQPVSSPP